MNKIIHKVSLAAILITAMALIVPAGLSAQTTHKVTVRNNVFSPKDITIQKGDVVEWTNTQGFHNVNGQKSTYPNNPESFGNSTGNGWTYSFTFTTEGKYDYRCDPHVGLGMVGTVTVIDDSGFLSLKVDFEAMNPHIGQMFTMYVKNLDSGKYVDSLKLEAVPGSDFDLESDMIEKGSSYHIDFYADHNGNGKYDAPPVDHAWRLMLNDVMGDTTLTFTHNINFTDIMAGSTGVDFAVLKNSIRVYPNPVLDILNIGFSGKELDNPTVSITNIAGQDMEIISVRPIESRLEIDMTSFNPGLYFLTVKSNAERKIFKIIKR